MKCRTVLEKRTQLNIPRINALIIERRYLLSAVGKSVEQVLTAIGWNSYSTILSLSRSSQ